MREDERDRIIEALAPYLAGLSVHEANSILVTAGADSDSKWNSEWWSQTSVRNRINSIKQGLASLSNGVLESLREYPSDDTQTKVSSLEPVPVASEAQAAAIRMAAEAAAVASNLSGPIFVVHGHAPALLHETVRVLERATGRDVTVLREQANSGRTILEKFEDHAAGAAFAVVLLTADDEGGIRTRGNMHLRGRQNVIFELGFFFGKLGRRRVAVLLEESVEKPSDVDGLVYITLNESGAWKYALARELEAAGISVDWSRIP